MGSGGGGKLVRLMAAGYSPHRRNHVFRLWCFTRVELRYNKPLYNEVLDITNDFLHSSNSNIYEKKNLDITKPRYSEHNLPVPRPFVIL